MIENEDKNRLDKDDLIRIAKRAIEKRWDFETLKYGDDLYGNEDIAEDVWAFVEECDEIGQKAFYEKYPKEVKHG